MVFSAPECLQKPCKQVNSDKTNACSIQYRKEFVTSTHNVVYAIPLWHKKTYVGESGRCINERLKEHQYNVTRVISGHLGIHWRDCGCKAMLKDTSSIVCFCLFGMYLSVRAKIKSIVESRAASLYGLVQSRLHVLLRSGIFPYTSICCKTFTKLFSCSLAWTKNDRKERHYASLLQDWQ